MEQPACHKDIPQWKKDLIARLRSQNRTAAAAAIGATSQSQVAVATTRPSDPSAGGNVAASVPSSALAVPVVQSDTSKDAPTSRAVTTTIMVQERVWVTGSVGNGGVGDYRKNGTGGDGSDEEDLHYGPGIVKKLKNKYLSLALRESNSRPTILHMRKATSLEHLLDEEPSKHVPAQTNGHSTRRNIPNRYRRNAGRGGEMKRARSVETISRAQNVQQNNVTPNNRQSLHEEVLNAAHKDINEYYKKSGEWINRPKRIQPLLNEREKPPADVVKQAKMIFEKRPEQRTRAPPQTGEVAAKVDSFNNRIVKAKVEAKVAKKPPIKHNKPVLNDKIKSNAQKCPKTLEVNKLQPPVKKDIHESLPSPIPDVSRIDFQNGQSDKKTTSLSETPDLILTSSPFPSALSTEHFLKEEIRNASPLPISPRLVLSPMKSPSSPRSPLLSPIRAKGSPRVLNFDEEDGERKNGAPAFSFTNASEPPLNSNVSEVKTPPSEPLKIEINGANETRLIGRPALLKKRHISPPQFSPPPPPKAPPEPPSAAAALSAVELEKNLRNLQQPPNNGTVEVVNRNVAPKRTAPPPPRFQESNTAVFNFTSRKDVPDYIANDRSRAPAKPELPKPGEGGIILFLTNESLIDEEEKEIMRTMECPPSPCDVTFINDNILIDGKSSLSQRTRTAVKLKISFVDGPEVFEYPSETSLLIEETSIISPVGPARTVVPNLAGTTLTNYTPKGVEEFQPGVTRTSTPQPTTKPDVAEVSPSQEEEEEDPPTPLLQQCDRPFSEGANSDILF